MTHLDGSDPARRQKPRKFFDLHRSDLRYPPKPANLLHTRNIGFPMIEFLNVIIQWPILPATVLLGLVSLYWILVIVGAATHDVLDLHLDHEWEIDLDIDSHHSLLHWGLAGLKWFNLRDVPFMIWMSALALPAWLVSVTFDQHLSHLTVWEIIAINLRNFGIGLFAAKILTQPLKGKLKFVEPHPATNLIGKQITISNEATTTTGHALYPTGEGAPLQLNVRTTEGTIPKGTLAEIIDYDPVTNLYTVIRIDRG
ncbi:MAG: DUF1449 family protein [Planctomycetaceae bacterium]